MNSFLPPNYTMPKQEGNYYKFSQGQNRFRILSSAIVGWEYWTKDNKPVRLRELPEEKPLDMRPDSGFKHFWSFIVYNYDAKKPQIMQITQRTIQGGIGALSDNSKWGDVKDYDIVVTRTGEGLETEYSVLPEPKSPAPVVDISQINLNALYEGADPFNSKGEYPESMDPENIPF